MRLIQFDDLNIGDKFIIIPFSEDRSNDELKKIYHLLVKINDISYTKIDKKDEIGVFNAVKIKDGTCLFCYLNARVIKIN